MKIVCMCLAFFSFNLHAMYREKQAFLDTISPENILKNAVHNVFNENLSETDQLMQALTAHDTQDFLLALAAVKANSKTSNSLPHTLRSIISLNQAIMLGKLKAFEYRIEYEDFEPKPEPQKSFSLSYKDLNAHIYAWSQQIELTDHDQSTMHTELKRKIQNDKATVLTEDEILSFQKPQFLSFLGHLDISARRQQIINGIKNNQNLSLNEQNQKISLVEHHAVSITTNRTQYYAAIAAQNPEAISFHSAQPLHLQVPKTLLQQIQELRAEGATAIKGEESQS
jgi:hypothetical protein